MVFKTTAKTLCELNSRLKSRDLDFKYIFMGYMPTGKVGGYGNTRHYMVKITKGKNEGATYGSYVEIDFGCDEDDFDDLSDPKFFPQSTEDSIKRKFPGMI